MPLAILNLLKTPAPDDTSNKKRLLRDSLIELLATTIFVWAGTLSAVSTGDKLIALGVEEDVARILPIAISFGVSILALAYSIGHLTGGCMNPGVALLLFFRRELSGIKMLCYWVAEFLGAMIASAIVWGCTSNLAIAEDIINRPPMQLGATTLNPDLTTANGFLLEFMGSFMFYFVIAQSALDKRGIASTPFPAIPIGLVLVVVHICLVPFTGCGVNPARSFGPAMVVCMSSSGDCGSVTDSWYWIYCIGPFVASYAVAEVTSWMQMDIGEGDEAGLTEAATKDLIQDEEPNGSPVDVEKNNE